MKACITGGGGYVGHRLGEALLKAGYDEVVLVDLSPPAAPLPPNGGLVFAKADVRDLHALLPLFRGCAVVFHSASYGMSGGQQLQRKLVEAVNVGGTEAVIAAAMAAHVPSLVYLSTYNVVFGGQEILGGDETLPYFPSHQHPDFYSRTKAVAESAVLQANMTPFPAAKRGADMNGEFTGGLNGGTNGHAAVDANGHVSSSSRRRSGRLAAKCFVPEGGAGEGCLRTCALRPAGIYGPGELRHQPRIVRYVEMGLFTFVIGRPHEAIVDFVHVDNLVQACILAAEGLTAERSHVAAGQAYFIHDDWPGVTSRVNNFAFYGRLVTGLGYRMPRLALPLWFVYFLAWLCELAHAALWPLCDLSKLFMLTRAEALKAGRTHWFSVEKARRHLGYDPQRYSFQPVVDWFLERGHGRHQRHQRTAELAAVRQGRLAAAVNDWRGWAALPLLLVVVAALLPLWVPARQHLAHH